MWCWPPVLAVIVRVCLLGCACVCVMVSMVAALAAHLKCMAPDAAEKCPDWAVEYRKCQFLQTTEVCSETIFV